jgi:hypothetical protein
MSEKRSGSKTAGELEREARLPARRGTIYIRPSRQTNPPDRIRAVGRTCFNETSRSARRASQINDVKPAAPAPQLTLIEGDRRGLHSPGTKSSVAAGLRWAFGMGPNIGINTTWMAPVAIVLLRSANVAADCGRRSSDRLPSSDASRYPSYSDYTHETSVSSPHFRDTQPRLGPSCW